MAFTMLALTLALLDAVPVTYSESFWFAVITIIDAERSPSWAGRAHIA